MEMQKLTTSVPALPQPRWTVHLEVELTAGTPPPAGDELEPMVELMTRTEGVSSVAVAPLREGLAVAISLTAPSEVAALDEAEALVASAARYAHLGGVAPRRSRVTAEPAARG
jgi:hypothetical protein